jgi:hypothetical protein
MKALRKEAGKARGPTTAKNLEERFDRGETVLDYFDLARGRMRYPE